MPEEGHLLFQRAPGVNHAPGPIVGATGDHPLPFDKVPFQHVHVDTIRLVFGMQQLLDRRFVSLGGPFLQFLIWCAKASTPHEVSHKSNITIGHTVTSTSQVLLRCAHTRCLPTPTCCSCGVAVLNL